MAEDQIVTNIVANADFSNLIGDLNKVTVALSRLQSELKSTERGLANQIRAANTQFGDTLRSTGQFTSHFVTISSDVDKFGKSLDSGRMKLGQYFKVWQEHHRTAGGLIRDLSKQQVQMQNAILQPLGKNAEGMMRFAVHVPKGLDLIKNKTALARQEMAILNKVVQDGANQLVNWGKNTQWAGRQLTVGLTVPLAAFGKAAADAFRQADEELVRLTKVYGDLSTQSSATLANVRKDVIATARELSSSMGVSFKDTLGLAADIAATGKTGNELLGSIKETTRLAVLGEVDRQEAMKATLAIQTAFKQNSDELANSINFLNAVENQTSTTLSDLVEAIPRAGTVIKGMGGSVQDLALYLTAMREGGVSAAEGANALKSALASLINPTDVAVKKFKGFGIDLEGIVTENAGNLTNTILKLQSALDQLDPLQKQQAIEQLFGKFQFARLNALFENLGKQGSQTVKVLELMKTSSADLANIAGRELTQVTESASGKYRRAIETLRADLAKTGEQFLGIATKVVNAVDKVINMLNNLPDPIKKLLGLAGGFTALVGPLVMLTGVLGNFFGYIVKGIYHFKSLFKGAEGWKLLTPEIMAANNAGSLIEKTFYSDAKAAEVLRKAVLDLTAQYASLAKAAGEAAIGTGSVSTVAGNTVVTNVARQVDPSHPLVGREGTRSFAHMVPRKVDQPESIFGVNPSSGPVNALIRANPMIYAEGDLPDIPGLTTISGKVTMPDKSVVPMSTSVGVVANEAAKHQALVAALAMQSKEELAILESVMKNTGNATTEFIGTFDDILPITTGLSQRAAAESAKIVAQVQAGKLSIAEARAQIIQLNIAIEKEMIGTLGTYASQRGLPFDPYKVPMLDQPATTSTGATNMREMFKKQGPRGIISRLADIFRVRTSGAGYNIETTRPRKFAGGGQVPYTLSDGPIVPGPASDTTDTQFGMLPADTYIVNKNATANNFDFLSSMVGGIPGKEDGGLLQPVMLTPGEIAVPPSVVNQGNNLSLLEDINAGRIVMRRTGGSIPRFGGGGKTWDVRESAHLDEGYRTKGLTLEEKRKLAQIFPVSLTDLNNPRTAVKSGFYADYHKFFNQETRYGRLQIQDAISYLKGDSVGVDKNGNFGGRYKVRHDPMIAYAGIMDDLEIPGNQRAAFAKAIDAEIIKSLSTAQSNGKSILADKVTGANKDQKILGSIIGDAVTEGVKKYDKSLLPKLRVLKQPAEVRVPQAKPTDGEKRTRGVSTNRFFRFEEARASVARAAQRAGRRMPIFTGRAKLALRNYGGKIPGFQGGGKFSFLGMPRGIKSVLKDRLLLDNIDARVRSGQFKDMEPTDYGHLLQETSGHSFPVQGIGGLYRKPSGDMVFVKPVLDEKAALAEVRATTIAREAHGLNSPKQSIRVMIDPTDINKRRKILVLESPYDKSFVGGGNKFTRKQYFSQLVAALLRGDKDLSSSNVFGGTLADVGTAGVFGRASGKREFSFNMPRMSEFADTVLLGRKGGARKDFAYNTASLVKNMSPMAYHRAMIDEIDTVLPKLKETIKSFNLTSVEKAVYDKMIKRLEDARNEDWTKAHATHKAVKPVASKNLGGSIKGYQGGGKVVGGVQYKNLGGVLRAIWTTIRGALSGRAATPTPVIPVAGVRNIPFQAPGEPSVIPSVGSAVTATETVGKDMSPFGFRGQATGMAGAVAGTVIGQSVAGTPGAIIGGMVGNMAMFLPQLMKARGLAGGLAQIFSKMFIPTAIISGLFIAGKYLLDLKKKMEDYGKAQRLAFGGTKESFASVGIKNYTTLSDRLKNINDQLELHKATVKSVYESYTKTGVTGLSLTIKELAEAIKKAKTEQKDFVKAFDMMSAAEVNQKAAMFKAQFIAMGMSAQEATNRIYAIIKASNKASQAFNAITSKDFTSMQTSLDGIKFVVDYLSKTLNKAFDKGTAEEFSSGLDTLLNAVISYRDGLIGAKDEQGNIRDEADATAETLDKISKIQGAQGKLTADQLDKLKSANIVYAGILSSAESLESVTAKILLYTGGLAEVVNLSAMSADAAIALAKDFTTVQNVMNSVTEDINTADKFRNSLSPLSIEIDRVAQEANKAENAVKKLKKVDEQYYKDKMAAIDDLIKKLEKERDARLKLLDTQERASTFENQLKSAQIKYQQALTAGNLAQAAQEQLGIQQLSADRQRQLTRDAISDKYAKDIEKLQSEKDALQKELDAANKNYASKTAAATQKTAELARLKAYRDELEMIALRNVNKTVSGTDSMRIENILKEMTDAGGYLAKVASDLRASNPAVPGIPRKQAAKSFSQVLVENLNADVNARAAENKDFASAVSRFVAAVDKFAGGTSAPFRDPTKSEKNEKGWLKATASALGITNDTAFDTSTMIITNPKTGAMYYIPLDSPRFKDAYNDIVAKGYNFVGWQNGLPATYSKDQVLLDPNKLPKAAYGKYFKQYADGSTDGPIAGPGTGTSDSIFARVSNGEFVTRASSVSEIGSDNMHLMNQKGSQGLIEAAVRILGGKAFGGSIPSYAIGGESAGGKRSNKDTWYDPKIDKPIENISSLAAKFFAYSPTTKPLLQTAKFGMDVFKFLVAKPENRPKFTKEKFLNYLDTSKDVPLLTAFNQAMLHPIGEIAKGSATKGDWFNAVAMLPLPTKLGQIPSIVKGAKEASALTKTLEAVDASKPLLMPKQRYKQIVDSIYKRKNIEIDKNIYPTYTLGKDSNPIAFQGYGEDLSKLSQTGVRVVPTTPEGMLAEALRLNPKDKNIQSMLANFKNNTITDKETQLLDNMLAAVSINKRGAKTLRERPDGFAMLLASLSGDANATKIVNFKTQEFYKAIEKNKNLRQKEILDYKSQVRIPEGEIDPSMVPMIHSTGFPIMRDVNGNIILHPYGHHNVNNPDPMARVPRASLHFTAEDTVKSHIYGSWDTAQQKIVSPLSSMIADNGLPYNLNSTDTWWMRNPGQPLRLSNTSLITPYKDTKTYTEELIKRGIIKSGDPVPVIAVDSKTKDVLHLNKESYTDADREVISRLSEAANYYSTRIPGTNDRIMLHRPEEFVGHENQLIDELALQLAKKNLKIETPPTNLEAHSLGDSSRQAHIDRIAQQLGLSSEIHNGGVGPAWLEKDLMERGSAPYSYNKLSNEGFPLEGLRYSTRYGRFKTDIQRIKDMEDKWILARGGYIKKFHTLRGEVPGPYGQEVGAVLRAKTESVYPTDYVDSLKNATISGNTYVLKNEIHAAEGMDLNQLADVVTKRTLDTIKSVDSLSNKAGGINRKFGGAVSR